LHQLVDSPEQSVSFVEQRGERPRRVLVAVNQLLQNFHFVFHMFLTVGHGVPTIGRTASGADK